MADAIPPDFDETIISEDFFAIDNEKLDFLRDKYKKSLNALLDEALNLVKQDNPHRMIFECERESHQLVLDLFKACR